MASVIYPSRARIAFDGVSLDALTSTASATAEAAAASATFTLTFTLTEPLTWDGTNISDEDRAVIDAGVDACLSASAFCAKWPRVNEAADLLVFVATGGWTRAELHRHIASYLPSATTKGLAWLNSETVDGLVARIVRRAKAERRVWWCPYTRRYEALPAWRRRPTRSRYKWPWPS